MINYEGEESYLHVVCITRVYNCYSNEVVIVSDESWVLVTEKRGRSSVSPIRREYFVNAERKPSVKTIQFSDSHFVTQRVFGS